MHASEGVIRLIKRFEGFSSRPYRDAVGVWTIGFGHTAGVGPGTRPITLAQGESLLRHDLAKSYEPYINRLHLPLNQNQFDATLSAIYNLGPGILDNSRSFGHALRRRQWTTAANALLLYDHAGGRVLEGLRRRRIAERALFLRPVKTHDQRLVAAWRKKLEGVRSEVRRRKAHGQVAWTPKLRALAKELEADIARHT